MSFWRRPESSCYAAQITPEHIQTTLLDNQNSLLNPSIRLILQPTIQTYPEGLDRLGKLASNSYKCPELQNSGSGSGCSLEELLRFNNNFIFSLYDLCMTPEEESHRRELLGKYADQRVRDEKGHFIHSNNTSSPPPPTTPPPSPSILQQIIPTHVTVDKTHTDDTLLDVHLGNPLRKITMLLEEIKKQKAFSFTLKGSLGIMGVVLALSTFGIFGGNQLLCNKGTVSQIGTLRQLSAKDDSSSTVPVISPIINFYNRVFSNTTSHPRLVLIRNDQSVLTIPYSRTLFYQNFLNQQVIVTGEYNSCSATMSVSEENGIEGY